jgi:hypothetical protein
VAPLLKTKRCPRNEDDFTEAGADTTAAAVAMFKVAMVAAILQ